jgi:Ca2+-binding EF-hand superfamily protein
MSSSSNRKLKLNQETIVESREAFDLIDQAREGAISVADVGVALRALGIADATSDEIGALLPKSASKVVSFDQFLTLVAALRERRRHDSELAAAFRLFDRRNTGRITLADLRATAQELNESFSEQDLLEMIAEADQTGQANAVSLTDFQSIMRDL